MEKHSTTQGYAGRKRRTNISIDGELSDLAQDWFANTRYGSLSGFVEAKLRSEFRTNAAKLRKSGHKVPRHVFE